MEHAALWDQLATAYALTPAQIEQFQTYRRALAQAAQEFNVTTEISEKAFIGRHVADSLEVTRCLQPWTINHLADVGTGGGFPGVPLAIAYPQMQVLLIEVNHKKVAFLRQLCDDVRLTNVTFYTLDWRTFLRKTEYPIDLFCARASLEPEELVRMFKPSSPYRHARLAYWASTQYVPLPAHEPLVRQVCTYTAGSRQRKLYIYGLSL